MAKKGIATKRWKNLKGEQIDMLPKLSQQPRSSPPKRRIDFSLFFSGPDFSTSFDISATWRQSFSRVGLSSMAVSGFDDSNKEKFKHAECDESLDNRLRLHSNALRDEMESNESAAYDVSLDPPSGSSMVEQNEKAGVAVESNDVMFDRGRVVWAKTAGQIWWPAEIMGESSTLDDSIHQGINGHVLVQFYWSNQIAWVDPAIDLSQLEECFEERSCNSMDEFQEALRLALNRKEQLTSSRLLFKCNNSDESDQPYQSSDKWASSISSRIEEEDAERGRGKRKRKPKVHFDEVAFSPESTRKIRQLRIMRTLGLTAPNSSVKYSGACEGREEAC